MSRLLLATAIACCAHAASLCTTFTPASPVETFTQSGKVCQVGGVTISNLYYEAANEPNTGAIAVDIDTSNPSEPVVTFQPSGNWSAPAGGQGAFVIFFSVSVASNQILGAGLGADGTLGWDPSEDNVTPGSVGPNPNEAADITGLLSVPVAPFHISWELDPSVTNSPAGQLQNLVEQPNISLFANPVGSTSLRDTVGLWGGDSGFANGAVISEISDTILLAKPLSLDRQEVPEPTTLLFVSAGLLLMAPLRRRLSR
jgi:hypothetical protein